VRINKIKDPLKRIEAKIDYLIIEDKSNWLNSYHRFFLIMAGLGVVIFAFTKKCSWVTPAFLILAGITLLADFCLQYYEKKTFKKRYFKRG